MNNLRGAKRGGFIFTATLLLFLATAMLGRAILSAAGASETVFYSVNALISFAVFFTVPFAVNKGEIKILAPQKFSFLYAFVSIMLALGMLFGLGFLNTVIFDFIKSFNGNLAETEIPLEKAYQYVLFSVFLALCPAIAEELFFRGTLTKELSGLKSGTAIITVALCFALYHGSISQFAYQFIYGVGLGLLVLKTGSVLYCMLAHFLNNFTVLTVEYFSLPLNLFSPLIIISGLTLLAGFIVFIALYKNSGKKNVAKTQATSGGAEKVKDFYIPFGIFGVIMSAVIILFSVIPTGV